MLIPMAFGAVWLLWGFRPLPPAPLEPGWVARALVLAGDGVRGTRDGDSGNARFSEPFGLAVAAVVHSLWAASGNLHLLFVALVAWPVITALPAFLVALAASAVLARLSRRA